MPPGSSSRPVASITRSAASAGREGAMSRMRSPSTRMSAAALRSAVTTVPLRMRMLGMMSTIMQKMLRYLVLFVAFTAWAEDSAYRTAIAKWREQKEAELTADGGWLTVTGLIWLKEGDNRVAKAPGVFALHEGKT